MMWLPSLNSLALCAIACVTAVEASTFSPARPPAIPLAVRSPYLNTYLFAGASQYNSGQLPGQWPRFWDGQVTGWTGMIRVDGHPYVWMGDPSGAPLATQTSFEYTSTKSIFTMNIASKVGLKITFLSPVQPDDLKRQSLIFSYLHVEVQSIDGQPHDVQLYSDVSAEWAAGDRSAEAQWDFSIHDNIAYHRFHRQTQLLLSERQDQAEWGNWYWSTENVPGLTYQSGADRHVRKAFTETGQLNDIGDLKFRKIYDDWPVFAFAVDLGAVGRRGVETVFTIGLAQEIAIKFLGNGGLTNVPSLWKSYFPNELDAMSFFYKDFANASVSATRLDERIARDSVIAGGRDYLTITSLSTRQAMGGTQLVGTKENPYLFVKEISSDGNVLTVDVIFPFHPILLYLEPSLIKLMLIPLLENQESGNYPNKHSIHDLGAHYPNATGHSDGFDEPMPLEECGNMLIMMLAYAQRTTDYKFLSNHYNILTQWTQFLVDEALVPAEQISTDDFAGSLVNQTNLALKGIIGIEAMSQIAHLTDHHADAAHYHSIATSYITQWRELSTTKFTFPPHTTLNYGNEDSHGLLYNLYADALLGLDLVPKDVYVMQSEFYATIMGRYGVSLDTRLRGTKSDWLMFCAAVAKEGVKRMFVNGLARWIGETRTERAMTDLFDVETGDYAVARFVARPVVGGHFALLALPTKETCEEERWEL